ncbi:hypothetical protein ABZS86_19860 [Streptomyces sp. NPDC005355]|uniref:hypothetical protein n=1 Tax=Streptomyces sp. NPDC005355 TaxID=3157038 RepID=UPI0033BB8531
MRGQSMRGQRRATAWCGRLLLCAALLFGIVTMHTLGHPSEGGGAPHDGGPRHTAMDMAAVEAAPAHAAGDPHPAPAGHGDGMAPLSVCLAVLGAAPLALLIGAATFARRAGGPTAGLRPRLPSALRPLPPPGLSPFSRLLVLRI